MTACAYRMRCSVTERNTVLRKRMSLTHAVQSVNSCAIRVNASEVTKNAMATKTARTAKTNTADAVPKADSVAMMAPAINIFLNATAYRIAPKVRTSTRDVVLKRIRSLAIISPAFEMSLCVTGSKTATTAKMNTKAAV